MLLVQTKKAYDFIIVSEDVKISKIIRFTILLIFSLRFATFYLANFPIWFGVKGYIYSTFIFLETVILTIYISQTLPRIITIKLF